MSFDGLFVSFEGCDGSGKSTLIAAIGKKLKDLGCDVVLTREPGGTLFGEMVRERLLDRCGPERGALAEMFLYAASRAEIVRAVIGPALREGKVVLSERFSDSTLVYQGFAGGVDFESIKAVNEIATGGVAPHLTFVLDIKDAEVSEGRLSGREKDKIEMRDGSYHAKVREGYRVLGRKYPDRIRILDGSLPPEDILAVALSEISKCAGKALNGGRSQ